MKRAIFFDIDGTILDCLNGIIDITPRVKKAIRSLQSNGDYVFIATGRPYAFLNEVICDFGFDGFVLTNGAYVKVKEKCIYKESISKDSIKEMVCNFEKLNIQHILQGELYSYIKDEYKELHSFYDSFSISKKYLEGNYNIGDVDIYKIEMLCSDKSGVDYCLSLGKGDYDYIHNVKEGSFELYSKSNTKASGIIKVLDYLDIPVQNSYAFGDGKNDIEMLSSVGCGIAMGNAEDYVKSYAKKITDTVQNDGVALEIEKFIL
ncbi:Cof-type HAD-IIB family hydrolase [Clostridium chromiireducens]|uniref:Cof-type HAD-IIB family hydrolase n=1 Tax=Clostridium chromiireducens TaxID=225345 RepID=A0A1V4IU83_9CLOT|nr:Cof-type HAD-IIB family hydrolase [Clostridium chromiireducens]OPJ63334.1 sugar phosphatase YidA [Clostridium chromiireducens]RII33804.1 Cof-type HAD-IIB family hydrolase [Clostridium chromiireducens]